MKQPIQIKESPYNMDPSLLDRFHLFTSLPESERAKLAEILRITEPPAHAIICREGDPGDRMYLIYKGKVEVVKAMGTTDEKVLTHITAGGYFGEISLLQRLGLRTATVRSLTPTTLLEMTRADFESLMNRWPNLALDMLRELSLRMSDSQTVIIQDLQEKNIALAEAYRELQAAQTQIIEKEKLERELQLAQHIQMSMLPSGLPETHGFDFGAKILPARTIGGDLYDFVPINQTGTIGILVGDVSDKGVPAALFMALTRSLLRAEASLGLPPAEVLQLVNYHLLEMNKSKMFVSMLYGILTPETGDFTYARAGHEIPMIVDSTGNLQAIEYSPGQLVGIFPEPLLDQQSVKIPQGATLLLYTDGVTDANNSEGDFFGSERLQEALRHHRESSAQEICDKIFAEIIDFQGITNQMDDITLVAVRSKC
jgi:serine phosphatase RsbU (regulator of sigma subunit)